MAFRVETTSQADADSAAILDWLTSQHAGDAGLRWFHALQQAIASLANMPFRCPLAPENREFPYEVRQLLYGRKPQVYRVLFTVKDSTVYILHVRHGRRRPVAAPGVRP